MKLYHLNSGPLRVNTYFLVGDEGKAVVIDSGENYNAVVRTAERYGLHIDAVLLTHAHFDHAGNVKKLQDGGAKIYVGEKDAEKLLNDDNLASSFGRRFEKCRADVTLKGGDVVEEAGLKIKVLETPGHTDGSLTYLIGNMLFTGDTLFLDSVGRTDFPSGSRSQLINSIRKLFALDGDFDVYPGHEEFTTLTHERKYNTFADYD